MFNSRAEFAPVRDWLASELNRLDRENRAEPDEPVFRQRQGASMTLYGLLSLMASASSMADKLQEMSAADSQPRF